MFCVTVVYFEVLQWPYVNNNETLQLLTALKACLYLFLLLFLQIKRNLLIKQTKDNQLISNAIFFSYLWYKDAN